MQTMVQNFQTMEVVWRNENNYKSNHDSAVIRAYGAYKKPMQYKKET